MSIGSKTRFEVFKRDRYTCAYCGGHPPDVLLEIDHVVPRAAGGGDEMENLVTACQDCNRGKSDRLLDESGHPLVGTRTLAALEERLEQARAYVDLLSQLSSVTDLMLDRIKAHWAAAFGAVAEEDASGPLWRLSGGAWPKEATVRQFLRELDLETIVSAIDIAASRIGPNPGNDRYFYAICWRLIRDKQAASQPPDPRIEELEESLLDARNEVTRLWDQNDDLRSEIADLKTTVRRFREEAGR